MSQSIKSRGIVLKTKDAKGADRFYIIYTKDFGKVFVKAAGVKKPVSKLSGHLEPFCLSEFFIARGKKINRLAGAKQVECFYNLKKDYEKISVASYLCEIYDELIKDESPDRDLYEILEFNLKYLNENDINWIVIKASILKILSKMGYEPILEEKSDINKIIKFFIYEDFENITKLRLSDELWKEISKKIDFMLKKQLEENLQTEKFLL
ncbi:MAG: DNA repair protein RecO [Patescibacteria group bacterium]